MPAYRTLSDNVFLLPVAPPAAAERRLARALVALNHALQEQREAVAAWQAALAKLQSSVRTLGDSVAAYRGRLDTLRSEVVRLHEASTRLEATAARAAHA